MRLRNPITLKYKWKERTKGLNKNYKKKHICKNCGIEFLTQTRTISACCSDECNRERLADKRRTVRERKPYVPRDMGKLNCKLCGKEFIKRQANQIFCSKKCCNLHYKNEYSKIELGITPNRNNKAISLLKLRFEILKRDGFVCQYCGRNPKDNKTKLRVDHIIPKSKGGTDEVSNLITSCEECNLGKKDTLLSFHLLKKENGKK